jgi:hypothetical protein
MLVSHYKRNYKILIAVLSVLFIMVIPTVFKDTVSAAPVSNEVLTITPVTAKPLVNPGGQSTDTFQIINQGIIPYSFTVYSAPYSVKGEDYTPSFVQIPGTTNASKWITFDTTKGRVEPDQSANVGYTINVPKGTAPGGYYAVALAETQLPKTNKGIVVNEQVGEIFYIQVTGPVKSSGKVLSWEANSLQKPPLLANLRLENSGGIHYFSNINIVVSDIFGNSKFNFSTQKVVLPQTIRLIPATWTKAPSLGLFKVNGTAIVLGKTQELQTKYVLVASQTIRKVFIITVAVVALMVVSHIVGRHKSKKKNYK